MTALVWAQKSSFSDFYVKYPKGRDFPGLFSCACYKEHYVMRAGLNLVEASGFPVWKTDRM